VESILFVSFDRVVLSSRYRFKGRLVGMIRYDLVVKLWEIYTSREFAIRNECDNRLEQIKRCLIVV
jgi:hypothetical protein